MTKDLNSVILTRQELNIMKVVWDRGGATTRAVYDTISREKRASYFSIMTMMRTLEKKGLLIHSKIGRAFFYTPILSRRQAAKNHIRNVLENYFDSDPEKFVEWMSRNTPPVNDVVTSESPSVWQRSGQHGTRQVLTQI